MFKYLKPNNPQRKMIDYFGGNAPFRSNRPEFKSEVQLMSTKRKSYRAEFKAKVVLEGQIQSIEMKY